MKLGTITLSDLSVMGTHGVLESEHVTAQEFRVSVEITLDIERAAETDNIADTISYADVADAIMAVVEGEHCDLIETLAERIAEAIIDERMEHLSVTVHKPNAPIPHTFGDVSVTIDRAPASAIVTTSDQVWTIGLGSNLDDPVAHIEAAATEIAALGWESVRMSGLYRTAPRLAEGQDDQPDYYNAVLQLTGYTSPRWLLDELQCIERRHGRVRHERWGARTLDLDIIDITEVSVTSDALNLPHPRAHERRFVLEPWAELEPDAVLRGRPIRELLAGLSDQRVERVKDGLQFGANGGE